MLNNILTAIPIGFLISFSIGPVFFILLETSVTKGFRAALAFDAGVMLADILFIVMAFSFTSSMLYSISDDPRVFLFGGLFLIAYSIYSIYSDKKRNNSELYSDMKYINTGKNNYVSLFFKGFFVNFINVVVLVFWLSVIVISSPSLEMNIKKIIVFFSSILLTYLFIDLIKIFLAKKLSNSLTPRNIYRFKIVTSFIILVFGVVLVFRGIFPETSQKVINKVEHNVHIEASILKLK